MRKKLAKLLVTVSEAMLSGGISVTGKSYSERREAIMRENCRIIHEGSLFQKIFTHIATGGIHVCYKNKKRL